MDYLEDKISRLAKLEKKLDLLANHGDNREVLVISHELDRLKRTVSKFKTLRADTLQLKENNDLRILKLKRQ